MNRTTRLAVAAALGTLMAYAVAAPAGAAGPFDGTYRGTSTNITSGGGGCPSGGPLTKTVVNNTFGMSWSTSEIKLTVGPDGTITGSAGVGKALFSATGKIVGSTMAMEYGSLRCRYRFEGRKGG
jgi:hypothetical protein